MTTVIEEDDFVYCKADGMIYRVLSIVPAKVKLRCGPYLKTMKMEDFVRDCEKRPYTKKEH